MSDTMKYISVILAIIIVFFLAPLFCMIAWNIWAGKFNLPQFGYWEWFITVLAIHAIRARVGSIDEIGDK